jgi:hypothetical protein
VRLRVVGGETPTRCARVLVGERAAARRPAQSLKTHVRGERHHR